MSSGDRVTWWEEDPTRLEFELAAIRELTPKSDYVIKNGLLCITTEVTFDGKPVEVLIIFSADHPYVAPTLYSTPGIIERHQNPISGNFCIIDNKEHWWQPEFMAAVLVEQLQNLLNETASGQVHNTEHPMPEPLSGHLSGRRDRVVLIMDLLLADSLVASHGAFKLTAVTEEQWVVTELSGENDEVITSLSPEMRKWFGIDRGKHRQVKGLWKSLDHSPKPSDAAALTSPPIELIQPQIARRLKMRNKGKKHARGGAEIWTAVSFIEQGPTREQERRVWLFYAASPNSQASHNNSAKPIKTQAISRETRNERIPELVGLDDVSFLLVGAGSLGGMVAMELARAGAGQVDVVDDDYYDVNNSVRHPLSPSAAGLPKAQAICELAASVNPFTNFASYTLKVGSGVEERAKLEELLARADIVIDATGMHDVARVLHRRACVIHGKPLVSGALSIGGYGGRIFVLKEPTPCFDCFLRAPSIPLPLEGPRSERTPYGCSHPAASCAGFDAAELSANIVRTAVRVTGVISYPALDFDWATINFRPGGARWSQGRLEAENDCPWCS